MDFGELLELIGLDSATAWATVVMSAAALAGAVWSLVLLAWGRRTVEFWTHDVSSNWRMGPMGDHEPGPIGEIRCTLSNVGDTTALGVKVLRGDGKVYEHRGFDRGAREIDVLPIVESGTSTTLWFEMPVDSWEGETLELSWRQAPTWRGKVRRQTIPIGQLVPNPRTAA